MVRILFVVLASGERERRGGMAKIRGEERRERGVQMEKESEEQKFTFSRKNLFHRQPVAFLEERERERALERRSLSCPP